MKTQQSVRAHETPLILDEGEVFSMHSQEYSAIRVTMTSFFNGFGIGQQLRGQ